MILKIYFHINSLQSTKNITYKWDMCCRRRIAVSRVGASGGARSVAGGAGGVAGRARGGLAGDHARGGHGPGGGAGTRRSQRPQRPQCALVARGLAVHVGAVGAPTLAVPVRLGRAARPRGRPLRAEQPLAPSAAPGRARVEHVRDAPLA